MRWGQALLALGAVAACQGAARGPEPNVGPAPRRETVGSPGAAAARVDTGRPRHTAADVRFMQGMIGHHAQALAMTALVPARTQREDMRLLAERIDVSQRDEIAQMRQWLRKRGESIPDTAGHHAHTDAAGRPMHGMLTHEEMTRLADASGAEFERLFLELMIRHHEGALTMVAELFGTPGAAQETETYRFATDVDADQRAEIARMRALLERLPPR